MELSQKQERLVFIPKDEEENKMSLSLKRLASQDETTQHDLLKEALQLLFVKHNLDLGGNPQRQLFSFTQEQIVKPQKCECANCEELAVGVGLYKPKNQAMGLCLKHFRAARIAVAQGNGHLWADLEFLSKKQKELT